ncbi:D-arabinono-1,4-lactone oxidase-domain-containing protein [Mycena capillaripes]|nr:D-arabinono-1,4-lactone oxidase-domain-containing protein [Mycena capillaripes]
MDHSYAALSRAQLVEKLAPIARTTRRWENWARTFVCTPRAVFVPTSVHHCRLALELATRDQRVLRPVGIGHSPSDVACTNDYMLNMTSMNAVLEVNVPQRYVVAQAGITLTDLHAALAPHNLAMCNLGSISDQTLAGIVATATHGSGSTFGVMSTHVLFLTLLTPSNTILHCSPTINPDLFDATVCGLGATGLILSIALEVEEAFRLRDVHSVKGFDEVVRDLDVLKASGEHVRFWWFPAVGKVRVMAASRTKEPPRPAGSWFWNSFIGFHAVQFLLLLTRYARPLRRPSSSSSSSSSSSPSSSNSSSSLRRLLPWTWIHSKASSALIKTKAWTSHLLSRPLAHLTRDAHIWAARLACWLAGPGGVSVDESVRVFNIECRYAQHTTEWALPAARAAPCLRELGEWLEGEARRSGGERPHFPIEVRFSKGDGLWLSPSNGGETCWIGIVQYKPYNLPTRYRALFATFESILAGHGGRPHWAKAHHLDACATRALYPQFGRFLEVVREVDPDGIFRNEYIERHLMGGGGDGREFKARRISSTLTLTSTECEADADEAGEDEDEEGETDQETGAGTASAWWGWPFALKTTRTKTKRGDWRTDWRVAPPAGEVRRRRERRAGLGLARSSTPTPEGSESDGSEDSEATIAVVDSGRTSPNSKTKTKKTKDEETPPMATELAARKHPARTLALALAEQD